MSLTLRSLFLGTLERFGRRPAVRAGEITASYAEIAATANRLAHHLVALGVTPGAPVALMMSNRVEWVVADQAIIRAGGAKVPINDMLSTSEMAFILQDCGAQVAVTDEVMGDVAEAAGLPHVIRIGPDWDAAIASAPPSGPPDITVTGADVGLIIYTGGTTGRQKGVVHTQHGLAINLLAHLVEIGLLDDERLLLSTPLPHSAGFLAQAGLLKGALHFIERRFDTTLVLNRIEHDGVTFLFMVPTMIYRLLDAAEGRELDLSSLRTILYGAAPITPERLEQGLRRFGAVFMQLYGQSEAPNFITRLTREDHDPLLPERLASCGRPATLVKVAVLDDRGSPLPAGQVGEICARAPYVMSGYRGLPDTTANTLRDDWLHTGDIGLLDEDGYLHLLDRKNDMIISGGMNVYTTEVEQVVSACPGVAQVAVVGVPHPDWGEAVVAFVVSSDEFDQDAAMNRCRAELAAYKRPKAFQRVEALPVTSVGKVDKKRLKAGHRAW
ncbi:Long-chain-fatty-acid--CoA ligase FadD13 [Mycolicibacterium vanbaalenii]|uniref:Long-chain-fatty-acid--CoA ligase FadD13 n=1 Tax=Mycolicibacterium vanbaalenii TaxID=110539 RepID=A0A5S9R041_MYCVN|nr:AMP-binding protein [Mycolicibacterium vanbaalenii]CAA0124853.1 Long-chain-fatty-acid--CoA ligase FadD13 [Mycolicibacterium vanbaalenii]